MSHPTPARSLPGTLAAVELPPDLPMAVFTSTERWHNERIGALALYCSDGRWGDAFDEFCHRHLLIPRYDRWAVPGGPAWLVPAPGEEEFSRAAQDQLDFLIEVHQLERIVLIAHYGCALYGRRLGKGPRECLPAQRADLRAAAAVLRRRYRGMRVESYLAMHEGNALVFRQGDV